MIDDDDTETVLELLPDEIEAPEIGDPAPEILLNADEAAAYLDSRCEYWRELPSTPPGVLMFGTMSFSQAELDRWLEKWMKHHKSDDDFAIWL